MRSYTVQENNISSVVSEILRYRQTNRQILHYYEDKIFDDTNLLKLEWTSGYNENINRIHVIIPTRCNPGMYLSRYKRMCLQSLEALLQKNSSIDKNQPIQYFFLICSNFFFSKVSPKPLNLEGKKGLLFYVLPPNNS